jgi:hypothetical protein
MLAGVTLALYRQNAALTSGARYRLGHTHEVIICPACLGMDAGAKPLPDSRKAADESGNFGYGFPSVNRFASWLGP